DHHRLEFILQDHHRLQFILQELQEMQSAQTASTCLTVLEAIVEMYKNPKQNTLNLAALLHEVYNDMRKLDLK
ncbi:hypothetical protein Tco_0648141, partial [Tanacetum coccineum]